MLNYHCINNDNHNDGKNLFSTSQTSTLILCGSDFEIRLSYQIDLNQMEGEALESYQVPYINSLRMKTKIFISMLKDWRFFFLLVHHQRFKQEDNRMLINLVHRKEIRSFLDSFN